MTPGAKKRRVFSSHEAYWKGKKATILAPGGTRSAGGFIKVKDFLLLKFIFLWKLSAKREESRGFS